MPCCIIVGVFLSGIWKSSADEIAAMGGDTHAPAPKRRFRLFGSR